MTIAVVIALVAALVAGAWLSMIETVLVGLDPVTAVGQGADRDQDLRWLVEHRGTALNVVLVATVTTRVTMTLLAWALARLWLPDLPAAVVAGVVVIAVSLLATEIAPRARALRQPVEVGARWATSARRFVQMVGPLAHLIVVAGRGLAGGRGTGPFPEDEPLGEDPDPDPFEEDERAMIRSVFELSATMAREIMVPRPDMVMVEVGTQFDELLVLFNEFGKSRIPVYREDREQVIGMVYAKDVLQRMAGGTRRRWIDLLRPAVFVPETKPLDDLLEHLQATSVHMAIVVDEYGAITGLVTIEDILEEVVGEIVDEHDDESPLVEMIDDDEWHVDARLGVDDLGELLGVELPDDDWDTVGGLVVANVGRVPSEGETVQLDGVDLLVIGVTGRRVARVIARRRHDHEERVQQEVAP